MNAEKTLSIEHHATLYACFARAAILGLGERGKEGLLEATFTYGLERGRRMAKRALANGDELSVMNSRAYGEWVIEFPGQMLFDHLQNEPTYQSSISKCAWTEAWKKHDLLDYGKYYCVNVDDAVFKGFNPDFTCTVLTKTLSFGGDRCDFDWGEPVSDEDLLSLAKKREELGTSCQRDFSFHTAHLLFSLRTSFCNLFPDEGEGIVEKALTDYAGFFGEDALASLKKMSEDFARAGEF